MYWKDDLRKDMKWPEDFEKYFSNFGLPGDTLVHLGHCTLTHGCKYLDEDCPIENGIVKPIFKGDPYELELIEE